MTSSNDIMLKSWLRTLRFSTEHYEDTLESENDCRCREYNRLSSRNNAKSMTSGGDTSEDSDDGRYVNIWDCASSEKSENKFQNSLESVEFVSLSTCDGDCWYSAVSGTDLGSGSFSMEETASTSRDCLTKSLDRRPPSKFAVPKGKKPVATPRRSKGSYSNRKSDSISEPIYMNLPLKTLDTNSLPNSQVFYDNSYIYENLTSTNNQSGSIYKNLAQSISHTSTDSLKFEQEVTSTIQYLENVLDAVDVNRGSSEGEQFESALYPDDQMSDSSSIDSKILEQIRAVQETKAVQGAERSSSFNYISKEQVALRNKKCNAFLEECEPNLPQEVKNIPLPEGKSYIIQLEKRFSAPINIADKLPGVRRCHSFKENTLEQPTYVNINKLRKSLYRLSDATCVACDNSLLETRSLPLNYAKESRISSIFEDGIVEELVPSELHRDSQRIVKDPGDDVLYWMTLLTKHYGEDLEEFNEQFRNIEGDLMEKKELLKSINQVSKDRPDRPKENKFPLDDDVKLRRKPEIRTNRLSKTTDYDSSVRKRNHDTFTNTRNFDIRGIMKIDLPTGSVLTKWKEEYISYENENFYRINEKTKNKQLLYFNVAIKSIRYPKSKESKEVEIRDNKSIFMLHFQELKYARQFMGNDRIQDYFVDNKHTIKKTLLRFLGKRSSIEILEKKGIYKNENIFANTLAKIYNKSGLLVPIFIYEVIQLVEMPENITTLGIYRTSGNLAVIQKIRCEVDNGRLNILTQYAKDPDVLTGSLKLFFRELKDPLISPGVCEKLLELTKNDSAKMTSKDHTKIRSVLIKNLHEANLETFVVLMKHLIEVAKYKEYNKMDAYNLAVCWGPTMIFSAHPEALTPATIELSKDIVTQSHDATRLVDFLLGYYELYPAELASLGRGPKLESESERLHLLGRQDSKDSMESYDSLKSKKSGSSVSLSVDEITKKLVEYIEPQISTEGLYLKQGSFDKMSKIIKKLNKKKINELEKYKNDALELAEALKKYLKDQDCLVTLDTLESVLRISPDSSHSCLEPATRRKLICQIEETPKKDTLIFLLRHLARVLEYQETTYGVPKNELLTIWSNVLNNQKKTKASNEEFEKFLAVAVKVFNDNLPDVVRSSFNNNGNCPNRNGSMSELFKEMKMQHHFQADQSDRNSRYDNVDSDVGEASILEETDEKAEQTKL